MLTEDAEGEKSFLCTIRSTREPQRNENSIVTVQHEPFISTFNVLKGFKCFKILILLTV